MFTVVSIVSGQNDFIKQDSLHLVEDGCTLCGGLTIIHWAPHMNDYVNFICNYSTTFEHSRKPLRELGTRRE